jgi:hypothetical protein
MLTSDQKAEQIYANIIKRINTLDATSIPSEDTQINHKKLIKDLIEFPSGSSTIDLWDKLDFFYFFDGDSDVLKFLNWTNPNGPIAELKNDSSSSINYAYQYVNNYQPEISENWWDNQRIRNGNFADNYNSKSKFYAYDTAIGLPEPPANASITADLIKEFVTSSLSSIVVNTGSFPNTYYSSSYPLTFTYYPDPTRKYYEYEANTMATSSFYNDFLNYYVLGGINRIVFFNSSSFSTSTIDGNGKFLSTPVYSVTASLEKRYGNPRIYPTLRILVTQSTDPISLEPLLTHIITVATASGFRNAAGVRVYGPSTVNTTFNYTNYPFNTSLLNLDQATKTNLQNWIVANPGFLTGTDTSVALYNDYKNNLLLYNGTYLNTNVNLGKNIYNNTAKLSKNDCFIGLFKGNYIGGGYTRVNHGYPLGGTTTLIRDGKGMTYAGVAFDTSSNASFAIQIDNRYYTGSFNANQSNGYKAALGVSLNNAPRNTNYGWKSITNSVSFPLTRSAVIEEDYDSGTVVIANIEYRDNESAFHGNTGMYLSQRFSSSLNTATIRQYYNNSIISESIINSNTGSIPDGFVLLGGLGTATYTDPIYTLSSDIPTLNVYHADITSTNLKFDYTSVNYTGSLLIVSSSISSSYVQEVSDFLYISSAAPAQGTELTLTADGYRDDIEQGSVAHLGRDNNAIGIVSDVNINAIGFTTEDPGYYTTTIKMLIITGSVLIASNSIIRTYNDTVGGIGFANQYIPTTLLGNVYIANITGSALYTDTNFNISSSNEFVLNSTKTLSYLYDRNTLPSASLNLQEGNDVYFTVSSSTSDLRILTTGSLIANKRGNLLYSGSETGTYYLTEIAATFVSSSNNYDIDTMFFTDQNNTVKYNTEFIIENGTIVNYPTSSIAGNNFTFKYTGSVNILSSQLTNLIVGDKIVFLRSNPDYGDRYFDSAANDIKDYDQGYQNPEHFDCFFAGGNVNGLDLSPMNKIIGNAITRSNRLRNFGTRVTSIPSIYDNRYYYSN